VRIHAALRARHCRDAAPFSSHVQSRVQPLAVDGGIGCIVDDPGAGVPVLAALRQHSRPSQYGCAIGRSLGWAHTGVVY
nr:hypothetical protein [Tanacetum cinerariifolium]